MSKQEKWVWVPLLSLLALAVFAAPSHREADVPTNVSRADVLTYHKFEKLAEYNNYLKFLVHLQHDNNPKRILPCDPPLDLSRPWLNVTMKGLLQEQSLAQAKKLQQMSEAELAMQADCRPLCLCGARIQALEKLRQLRPLTASQKKLMVHLQRANSEALSLNEQWVCARRQRDFCLSHLRGFLMKSASGVSAR